MDLGLNALMGKHCRHGANGVPCVIEHRRGNKMKYQIEIEEILQKVVEVEAESLSDAIVKVTKDYHDGEIELDAMDLKEWTVEEYKE